MRAGKLGFMLTALLGVVSVSVSAFAADPAAPANRKADGKVQVQYSYRGANIVGMPVHNAAGKDLGKIEDLVIDLRTGHIRYAALSFGGFLGVGDKLFAVPWHALAFKYGQDKQHFVLNVSEERLKDAPGFDKKHWPTTADAKWNMSIARYYADSNGAARNDKESDTAETVDHSYVFRLGTVTGMNVLNDSREKLGDIEDAVFDIGTGKMQYLALSFGGFLGVGDKLFALPWQAFDLKEEDGKPFLVLHVSPDKLKAAPGFAKDEWPDAAKADWRAEIDKYYSDDIRERERSTRRPTRTN